MCASTRSGSSPRTRAACVTAFLESFFARYVEYDFTAGLEEQLDRVSNNELAWRDLLRDFWRDFTAAVGEIKELRVAQVLDALDELLAPHLFPPRADGTDPRQCPNCATGQLSLKLGKFGAFIGCSNYPECRYTRQFSNGANGAPDGGMKKLGEDPETGLEVTLRSGRFGPYVQLGEAVERREAQARRLAKGVSPDDIDLERALGLLSLPREVGKHPGGRRADPGRHRPLRPLRAARQDLRQSRDRRRRAQRRPQPRGHADRREEGEARPRPPLRRRPGRPLGDHPDKGGPVVVKNGRYGPYVSHDGVNATLPSDKTPETITLEQALPLLDARAARGTGDRARRRRRSARAKPPQARAAKAKRPSRSRRAEAAKAKAAKNAKVAQSAQGAKRQSGKAKVADRKADSRPAEPHGWRNHARTRSSLASGC